MKALKIGMAFGISRYWAYQIGVEFPKNQTITIIESEYHPTFSNELEIPFTCKNKEGRWELIINPEYMCNHEMPTILMICFWFCLHAISRDDFNPPTDLEIDQYMGDTLLYAGCSKADIIDNFEFFMQGFETSDNEGTSRRMDAFPEFITNHEIKA